MHDAPKMAALVAANPATFIGDDRLTLITTVCRLSFVNFEKPSVPKGTTKDPRYSCSIILPTDADMSVLAGAAQAAWAIGPLPHAKPARSPFNLQKTMADKGYKGYAETGYYFSAETKNPLESQLFDVDMSPASAAKFYSGCYARVKVQAFAYNTAGNNGVKFWLQAAQFICDGEKLGGSDPAAGFTAGVKAAAAFGGTTGFAGAVAPQASAGGPAVTPKANGGASFF
jgi:hypothetical protein